MDKLREIAERMKAHAADPWAQGHHAAEFAEEALAVAEDQDRRIAVLENATEYTPADLTPLLARLDALEHPPK